MQKNYVRCLFLVASLLLLCLAVLAGVYTAEYFSVKKDEKSVLPELSTASIEDFFAMRLDDHQGKSQKIAQWQGKILVLNFWASWCPPCREEMPGFARVQTKYAAQGVQFLGIALDEAQQVRAFAERYPVNYPLLIGGDLLGVDLARRFGNSSLSLPYTVILNAAGTPIFKRLGRLSEVELEDLLRLELQTVR
ncbi:MAG: TlpA disulfide reductase family protein [Pseudomonadota bacterium]